MTRLRAFSLRHLPTLGAFGLFAVLFVVATAKSHGGFVGLDNLRQLMVFAAFVGIAALGQTVVILGGGLDLSVPWLMAFGGIQLAHWVGSLAIPSGLSIVLVVLAGAAIGLVNGAGVAWLRVPPIIMTLAVGGLVQAYLLAIGLLKSRGNQVPHAAVSLASGKVAGFPTIGLIWIGLAIAASLVLARTLAGRRLYAVGSSDAVARLAGVDVTRTRMRTYVISGAASTFAGVILSGYVGSAYLDIGAPYLFASIAAVVIGGASILGGHGSYVGTIAGALILTVLSALLPLFHLSDPVLRIVYGAVILVGVYVSRLGERLPARWQRRRAEVPPSDAPAAASAAEAT